MAIPYMAIAAAAQAAPAIAGMFGKKKRVRPEDFYTPDQLAAQRGLGEFSRTGRYGNFTAGEDIGLGLGDFNITDPERQGLTNLQSLLSSSIPDQYRLSDAALEDLMATSPEKIEAQFTPYKGLMERNIRDANSAFKRNASFAGNLYSTDAMRGLGEVEARGLETMSAKLADLTDNALNRRLQAVPLAMQSVRDKENMALGRVDASQRYGSLTRNLNDARIKARDSEILRKRQELLLPMEAARTLAGQEGRSFPEMSESPYQDLLSMLGQMGGQYFGNEMFLNQYKRYGGFNRGTASA